MRAVLLVVAVSCLRLPAPAADDAARNFSGNWILDGKPNNVLSIQQQAGKIHCTEAGADWSFRIDGSESKYRLRGEEMNSLTKWEGSALLINTLVSGPQNYVIMDRWKMSRDRNTLTITRTIQRSGTEAERELVYRNAQPVVVTAAPEVASPPVTTPAVEASPAMTSAVMVPTPAAAADFIIKAGTHIPLALVNSLSTKHTAEGDRVYLETVFPITRNGRIVIPKGSYVEGTVTEVKRAGRVKGKAELFLRFDSLTLPNGVTRDFRSRLGGADSEAGDLDRKEGKLHGESNKAGDARTIGTGAAIGAGVGGLAGHAAGHGAMGLGIGAATGAAAGLAGVLLSRGPDLVLPKGTTFEMVLDRTLRFDAGELEAH